MSVGVSKVETPATQVPLPLFFHFDLLCLEPLLPVRQFGGGNRECDVQLAVAVVWRLNGARAALLEQEKHLALASVHRGAAIELGDYLKSENLLVETNGPRYIAHVQRRFENSIGFWRHASHSFVQGPSTKPECPIHAWPDKRQRNGAILGVPGKR